MSGVCLPFISSVFLDLQLELFHNLTLLSADSPSVFPALVVLVTLLHLRAFFIYIFPSHNSCALPSLSQIIPASLSVSRFFLMNLQGKALSVSLWTFFLQLSKSVTTFSVRLPDPWKSIKGRQREKTRGELIPNPVSK